MNLNTEDKPNHSARNGVSPALQATLSARTQRKTSELSPSELRGIVIELLG
jgi:hypothetical protein